MTTVLASCDKEEDAKPTAEINESTISAKWVVNDSEEYTSFEFNESGNYIIVKKSATSGGRSRSSAPNFFNNSASHPGSAGRFQNTEKTIYFGTYEIAGNQTITLSDFGTITVKRLDDNSINFSLEIPGADDNVLINASKQNEIETSTNTILLCRTWQLVSFNGESVSGSEMDLTVLFSQAGTYFVSYPDGSNVDAGGLAQWRWNNSEETQLQYTWELDVWYEGSVVDIEVTFDSLSIFEDGDLWILKPAE